MIKSLYPKKEYTSSFGNSTKIFKLLMYLNNEEFIQLKTLAESNKVEKFKECSESLLEKYGTEISTTYINPAAVRIKLTEKLIPLDFEFLRTVAIAER